MKALAALRQAFGLRKTEELGKKFPPETLKRIQDAMQEYAASKRREQRRICQFEFETAYESEGTDLNSNAQVMEMYELHTLKESENPDFD